MEAFSGLGQLFEYIATWFFTDFNIRTIDTTTIPALLDLVYPIWNPIWAIVNQYLGEWFGF